MKALCVEISTHDLPLQNNRELIAYSCNMAFFKTLPTAELHYCRITFWPQECCVNTCNGMRLPFMVLHVVLNNYSRQLYL